jgi:hypothetical protein
VAVDRKLTAKQMAKPKIVALGKGKVSHGGFDIYPSGNAVWNAKVGELDHKPGFRDQYSTQTEHTGALSTFDGGREVTKAAGIAEVAMAMATPAIAGGSLGSMLYGTGAKGLKAGRIGAAIGAALGAGGLAFEAWKKRQQQQQYEDWASQGVVGGPRTTREQAVMRGFTGELGRTA